MGQHLLDDPEDGIDVLNDAERTFGVTISDREAAACATVGALYDAIRSRLTVARGADRLPCLTAWAYRRVVRALKQSRHGLELSPATPLSMLAKPLEIRTLARDLERETGLIVLPETPRYWFWIGGTFAIVLAAATALSVAALLGPSDPRTTASTLGILFLLGVVPMLVAAFRFGPLAWPQGAHSLGDLSSVLAALNIGLFAREKGAVRDHDLWDSLVLLLSRYCPRDIHIRPTTRFLRENGGR